MQYYTIIESPLGEMAITSDGKSITGLYTKKNSSFKSASRGNRDAAPFKEAVKQLNEYFAGKRSVFDLPLNPKGTEFQKRVWKELGKIGYGKTRTYGDVAKALGRPTASRAVGMANGRNPICIIVPCHRVIGANGKLTGYNGGVDVKKWLLELEGAA